LSLGVSFLLFLQPSQPLHRIANNWLEFWIAVFPEGEELIICAKAFAAVASKHTWRLYAAAVYGAA